jgi:hypothetical protein
VGSASPDGEILASAAAGGRTGYILQFLRPRDGKVRAASQDQFYQLYLIGGRGAVEAAIERARGWFLSAGRHHRYGRHATDFRNGKAS